MTTDKVIVLEPIEKFRYLESFFEWKNGGDVLIN